MSEKEIRIPQTPIMIQQPQFQQTNAQLTPEYLDAIINNPNEHSQVRKQALEMKNHLFRTPAPKAAPVAPKAPPAPTVNITEQDFMIDPPTIINQNKPQSIQEPINMPIVQEVIKKQEPPIPLTQSVVKQQLEIKTTDDRELESLINNFRNNLFNDEFILPTATDAKIQLRSMTVNEYKFLAKQFEIYQKSLTSLDQNNPEISREIDLRETILTNAIDIVLQRCITNNIKVYDLTFYDWVFSILALKAVSRGTDENLRVSCQNKDCRNEIKIGVSNVIKNIVNNKAVFLANPIAIVPLDNSISLYLSVPLRGDFFEAQKIFLNDKDSNLSFINNAMYIRAYIKDNVAHLLTPEQRFSMFNVLQYDSIKEIQKAINNNLTSFYGCFGNITCDKCGKITELDISDFILFFYDF